MRGSAIPPPQRAAKKRAGRRAGPGTLSRPPLKVWLESVKQRKDAAGTRVGPDAILEARDADRK